MVKILVVDDSALDRRKTEGLLRKHPDFEPIFAENGNQALATVAAGGVDIVLTDLQMPEMDGLALVEALRENHAAIPVILMTAHGSEETAVMALQRGAASYVPKRNLAKDLVDTVLSVLEVTHGPLAADVRQVLERAETHFRIGVAIAEIATVVQHFEGDLLRYNVCNAGDLVQVGVALREALVNAVEHGSLELASELRDSDPQGYVALAAQRRAEAPYRDRHVRVVSVITPQEVQFTISDEGPGFDPKSLPDPEDPSVLERTYGRGLLLIRTFMDEVSHNAEGNVIMMVKRRRQT